MDRQKWGMLSAVLAVSALGLLLLFIPMSRAASIPAGGENGPSLQSTNTFVISGTVRDKFSGQGIAGVEVFSWNRDRSAGFLGDVTDDAGYYSVTLEQGNYDVNFNPPCGSGYASQTHKGIAGPPDRTLDVFMDPGYTVSGTVYAPGGSTPVGNVAIYVFHHGTGDGFGLAPTDANGHYCIGLIAGTYDLGFTPPPCLGFGPRTITRAISEPVVIDVVLLRGFTVGGCVTDGQATPVAGVQIYAFNRAIGGFGFAPTAESGCYSGTLPFGTFDIQFMPPPGSGLGSVTVVDVVSQTAGCPNASLPVTLPAGFTLSGRVTCGLEPVKNVQVYAAPVQDGAPGDDLGKWGTYSVDDGSYGLALVSGTYRVTFEPPAWAELNAKAVTVTALHAGTDPITVNLPCESKWITETVDSSGDVQENSLGLESGHPDKPRISYWVNDGSASYLKYAWLEGTTWHTETVGTGLGGEVHLALAPAAPYTPVVSYVGATSRLQLAWLDGSTWATMTIPGLDKCCASLALEPAYPYHPHLSYFWKWGTARTLYHGYVTGTAWMGGEWVDEPVEPPLSQVGYASSLALEAAFPYRPHIAYNDHGHDDLKYAWRSDATWLTATLDSAGNTGGSPSLALDSLGRPHIGYLDLTNGTKYAWKTGATWDSMVIDSIGYMPYGTGRISLKLDRNDRPRISYYDALEGKLKYAWFDGTVWIIQAVDNVGDPEPTVL